MKRISMWMLAAIFTFCGTSVVTSCSNEDDILQAENNVLDTEVGEVDKNELMNQFAQILSKVVYENQQVRELIKNEAVKQFDKNYDVLWLEARDKMVGNDTFRNLMVAKSSEKQISAIEQNVPLLNILFPKIAMFDVSAENYDSNDAELPVAIPNDEFNALYFNGELTDKLEKGQVPSFNVLVVNENSRVIVGQGTRSSSAKYTFKSPNYDGTKSEMTRSANVSSSLVGNKAIAAYNYFYKDDSSVNSMALQRDYIYYGITPQNQSGALNYSVSEYISFIEVNPNAYFRISDQTNSNTLSLFGSIVNSVSDDPCIKYDNMSRKKSDFATQEELTKACLDFMWTKGAYNFRVEIQTSTNQHPQIIYLPLKPNEIWNFNLERVYRHSTMFRSSKYTYYINPNDFTAKRYELAPYQLPLGKWHLAEESIYRYVTFIEEDESIEKEFSYEYDVTKINSSKFSGDVKLNIGISDKNTPNGGVSTDVSNSTTTKETKTVKIKRKEESDDLGSVRIFFYDPIIEKKLSDTSYQMRTYNTGYITFGISAY